MSFGLVGKILKGLKLSNVKEGYDDAIIVERDLYIAELILFIAVLGAAVLVASRCGGGFRQYAGAILEPYAYLVIRLVVPCLPSNA